MENRPREVSRLEVGVAEVVLEPGAGEARRGDGLVRVDGRDVVTILVRLIPTCDDLVLGSRRRGPPCGEDRDESSDAVRNVPRITAPPDRAWS